MSTTPLATLGGAPRSGFEEVGPQYDDGVGLRCHGQGPHEQVHPPAGEVAEPLRLGRPTAELGGPDIHVAVPPVRGEPLAGIAAKNDQTSKFLTPFGAGGAAGQVHVVKASSLAQRHAEQAVPVLRPAPVEQFAVLSRHLAEPLEVRDLDALVGPFGSVRRVHQV